MQNIMEATLTKSSYNLIMPIDLSALLLSATRSLVDHWIRQAATVDRACLHRGRTHGFPLHAFTVDTFVCR